MSFTFDGMTVRPLSDKDRPYLDALIAADPYHRDRMNADYFLRLAPGEDSWALEDGAGRVVFYFKTATCVRMSIQFPPPEGIRDRARTADALIRGLRWIAGIFQVNKFREILFDTEGPELTQFAKKHLGFHDAPGLLAYRIPVPQSQNGNNQMWEGLPQTSEKVG